MLRAVAIDDEPLAISVIRQYLGKISQVELLATFNDPIEGLEFLNNHEVDMVFLDIQMVDLSGLDIAKSLGEKVRVIFTTAYSEHAVKSYELKAVDYLLKPYEFPRFLQAVQRVKSLLADDQRVDFIFLKTGSEHVRVDLEQILYVHASGNYMEFYVEDGKKILTRMTLSETKETLPQNRFIRIHKSWIVAVNKMDKVERHQVWVGDEIIPIGAQYRDAFFQRFSGIFDIRD